MCIQRELKPVYACLCSHVCVCVCECVYVRERERESVRERERESEREYNCVHVNVFFITDELSGITREMI